MHIDGIRKKWLDSEQPFRRPLAGIRFRPGPLPFCRSARPASGPPRRSALALATATARPSSGHWFQWPPPGVAAQIAVSNAVPDRPAETGHLATDQGHPARDRPAHPRG